MSSFQDFGVFIHNNHEAEAQRSYVHVALNYNIESENARNSFELLPQGYCERKPLNLEKTTSSVLSVLLLIYGCKCNARLYLINRVTHKD